MAVLKAKPEKVIQYLFPLLQRELIVPLLTTRISGDVFKGSLGDTVTMRVNGLSTVAREYEWRTRNAPIVLDDIAGGEGIPITFGQHIYSATGLTDEHVTMDEINLVTEVFRPQAEAVARKLEGYVVAAYAALETREEVDFTEGDTDPELGDPYFVALNAQAALDRQRRSVRGPNRTWLVGTNVATAILKSDRVSRYDSAGASNSAALRDATIAKIADLNVVTSSAVDPNFSVVTDRSSLVLATLAPVAPRGATWSSTTSEQGFGMRLLADYDSNFLRDRAITSMFAGISNVYDEVWLTDGDGHLAGDLKVADDYTDVGEDVPKSARAVKVNFTPAS